MLGIPVVLLKRTVTGVEAEWKWGALLREAAVEVGVKVPLTRTPLACAIWKERQRVRQRMLWI